MNPSLFLENTRITGEPPVTPKELPPVSLAKRLLLRVMIDSYNLDSAVVDRAGTQTINYVERPGQDKALQFVEPSLAEYRRLVENFRRDPKQACGTVRQGLINIARDKRLPESDRRDRLSRYLEGYLELIPLLDNLAFPPDSRSTVHEGVPGYIPDGLSDMGSDNSINPLQRSREKIRVVKTESYKKALPDMLQALWNLRNSDVAPGSDEAKEYLIKHTLTAVKMNMPYDYKNVAIVPRTRSVPLHAFVGAKEPVSVCRHIAMEAQIRMQALGLESRLLKCDMDGEPHVANLVRMNSRWHLADPTNPEADPGNENIGRPFMRPVALTDNPNQTWNLQVFLRDRVKKLVTKNRVYTSRNNMFYRILPAGGL